MSLWSKRYFDFFEWANICWDKWYHPLADLCSQVWYSLMCIEYSVFNNKLICIELQPRSKWSKSVGPGSETLHLNKLSRGFLTTFKSIPISNLVKELNLCLAVFNALFAPGIIYLLLAPGRNIYIFESSALSQGRGVINHFQETWYNKY